MRRLDASQTAIAACIDGNDPEAVPGVLAERESDVMALFGHLVQPTVRAWACGFLARDRALLARVEGARQAVGAELETLGRRRAAGIAYRHA